MPSRGARLATAGLWHLGSVASACLASLGHMVCGTDPDRARVDELSRGKPPVFEPGLAELIAEQARAGRLSFTAEPRKAFAGAEFIFVTYDTPVDNDDQSNLQPIESTFSDIAAYADSGVTIILMSQVPVGTCADLSALVRSRAPRLQFTLLYQPENLRLGEALDTFLRPDFLIFGAEASTDPARWQRVYEGINAPQLVMRWASAELAKHALNAFLATSISFVNELAELAEASGADIRDVRGALKRDRRIGPYAFLRPGPGFAGGTLGRDIQALRRLGERTGRPTPQLDATLAVNRARLERVAAKIRQACGGLSRRRVALLGLTYKPGTSTLRRSHAIELARRLATEGAEIAAFDPLVCEAQIETAGIRLCASAEEAIRGVHAVALVTPWPEFRELDLERLAAVAPSATLIDAHNFLDGERAQRAGWKYVGMGIAAPAPRLAGAKARAG